MQNILPPVDVTHFHFKLQAKHAIFDDKIANQDFFRSSHHLIQVAYNLGLIFIGCPDSTIQVIPTKCINEIKSNSNINHEYRCKVINVEGLPIYLSLNCTGEILAVVIQSSYQFIAIFDTNSIISTGNARILQKIQLNHPEIRIVDLQWNPSLTNILTYCLSDGSFNLLEFAQDFNFNVKRMSNTAQVTCFCWSPKGKQIVTGTQSGILVQYKPDFTAVKKIQVPHILQNKTVKAISLLWLSTNQYLVGYQDINNNASNCIMIINTLKNEPTQYFNYEDICYSSGFERPQVFHFLTNFHWNVILVASSNSFEISVLGKQNDKEPFFWQQWYLSDDSKAELPITKDGSETRLLGISMDLSSTHQIIWGENTPLHPMPVLHILASNGTLLSYNMINLNPSLPQICAPPQIVIDVEKYFSMNTHLLKSDIQQIPSSATNILEPKTIKKEELQQKQQQQQQKPEEKSVFVQNVQSQKPESKPLFNVSLSTPNIQNTNESIKKQNEIDTAIIEKLIKEELKQFNADFCDLKNDCLIQFESPNVEKVLMALDSLNAFVDELKNTTSSQTLEIHSLKQTLLQTFAWFEDAKSRYLHLQDPVFSVLIKENKMDRSSKKQKNKPSKFNEIINVEKKFFSYKMIDYKASELDPISEKQMVNIENLINYIDNQLDQVQKFLDNQWHEFSKKQKSKYITSVNQDNKKQDFWNCRFQKLNLKEIYQTIVNINEIIGKHCLQIKQLKLRLFAKKKFSSQATTSKTIDLIKINKKRDPVKKYNLCLELEKLKMEPITTLIDLKIQEAKNREKRLSNKKMDQLCELLENHKVIKTSSKETNTTHLSTSLLLSFRKSNNNTLNETKLIDLSSLSIHEIPKKENIISLNESQNFESPISKLNSFVESNKTLVNAKKVLPKSDSQPVKSIDEIFSLTTTPIKSTTATTKTTIASNLSLMHSLTENLLTSTPTPKMNLVTGTQNAIKSNFSSVATTTTTINSNSSITIMKTTTPVTSIFTFTAQPQKSDKTSGTSVTTSKVTNVVKKEDEKSPSLTISGNKQTEIKTTTATTLDSIFNFGNVSLQPITFTSSSNVTKPFAVVTTASSTNVVSPLRVPNSQVITKTQTFNSNIPTTHAIAVTTTSSAISSLFQAPLGNKENVLSNSNILDLSDIGKLLTSSVPEIPISTTFSTSTTTTISTTTTATSFFTSKSSELLITDNKPLTSVAELSFKSISSIPTTSVAVPNVSVTMCQAESTSLNNNSVASEFKSPLGNYSFPTNEKNITQASPFDFNKDVSFGSKTSTVTSTTTTTATTVTTTNNLNVFMGQQICSPFSTQQKSPETQQQKILIFGNEAPQLSPNQTASISAINPQQQQQQQQQPGANTSGLFSSFGTPAANNTSLGFSFLQSPAKTITPSPFGQQQSTAQTNVFGQPVQSMGNTFGQQTNLFGTNSNNSFASSTLFGTSQNPQQQNPQQSSFGNANSMFGSGSSLSTAFGTPSQKPTLFGNNASVSPGGFGAPPVFGSGLSPVLSGNTNIFGQNSSNNNSSFGSSGFGTMQKPFGAPQTASMFGSSSGQNSTFASLANQQTVGFGTLAQQSGQEKPPIPQNPSFTNNSAFSSWR